MTRRSTASFVPITLPTSVSDPDAAAYVAAVRVRNEVYAEIAGNRDEDMEPAELLPFVRTASQRRRWWAIVVDGEVVGRVIHATPLDEGARGVDVETLLLRSHWGRGIGRDAHGLLRETTHHEGRSVMRTWAEHPADARLPSLAAPNGFGAIPADHTARFLTALGYSLEQVERKSVLDLASVGDTLAHLLEQAAQASSDYRVAQWTTQTPTEYLDAVALMNSRMSTDAPAAGVEVDEEHWDAARVLEDDQAVVDSGGVRLTTAAQHIVSGALCAFTQLEIRADRTVASTQGNTLVLREHRGHRLGMLIKCAGLLRWRELMPDSPRVLTWNAEENRPMLDVNEAIGFRPAAYIGAWQLMLEG